MQDQTSTGLVSQHVSPNDLNLDWFEDKDLAADLSQDCLRLFQATESSFDEVRQQAWYKKLWSTLSGGNTRKLAQGCANLAQAQQLLLTVLQTHAKTSQKTNLLLMFVARGLRHVEGQQSQVVAAIVDMADRIELLEKEVQLHRRLIDSDPANETTWNQEQRLLLFKAIVSLAGPRSRRSARLKALLARRLDELQLVGDYRGEASRCLETPEDYSDDFERVDSYQMRLTMYRNAFGIASVRTAGGRSSGTTDVAANLATVLQIRPRDRDKVAALFAAVNCGDDEAVLAAMSPATVRGQPAPDRQEFVQIDSKREQLLQAAREKTEGIERARTELSRLAPIWADSVAGMAAAYLVDPVVEIWNAYEPSQCEEVEQVVASFSTDAILAAVNARLPEVRVALGELVDQFNEWQALPPPLYRRADEVWNLVVKDDGGWEGALSEVQAAGQNLISEKPSTIGQVLKGGALGYAGAALLGPVGWLGAIAAGVYSDNSAKEDYQRAIARWDAATKGLIEATVRWEEAAARHFRAYFEDLAGAVDRAIESGGGTCDPMQPLLLMKSNMESPEDSK